MHIYKDRLGQDTKLSSLKLETEYGRSMVPPKQRSQQKQKVKLKTGHHCSLLDHDLHVWHRSDLFPLPLGEHI